MTEQLVSPELLSVCARLWTATLSVLTMVFEGYSDEPLVAAARLGLVKLPAVSPEQYFVPLVERSNVVEWIVAVSLLPEYALAFVLRWRYVRRRDAGGWAADSGTLSRGAMFCVLENRRRRETLLYLRRTEGEVTLSELAEHIAAKENGVETHQLTSDQRKCVYVNLYQCHLPSMDDKGVIDYERERGRIELLDAASALFEYLDTTAETSPDR